MIKRLMPLIAATVLLQNAAIAQQTIRLGLLNVDGGGLAVMDAKFKDAAAFAIDTLNAQGGAPGRKYELVTQLHSGSPASAMAAASSLVKQSGAKTWDSLMSTSRRATTTRGSWPAWRCIWRVRLARRLPGRRSA